MKTGAFSKGLNTGYSVNIISDRLVTGITSPHLKVPRDLRTVMTPGIEEASKRCIKKVL